MKNKQEQLDDLHYKLKVLQPLIHKVQQLLNEPTPVNLRERLADLEHAQWSHWTHYMLDNLTPENIARWRKQIQTPYPMLSEEEKDSDRKWADEVIKIIKETK